MFLSLAKWGMHGFGIHDTFSKIKRFFLEIYASDI